MQLGRTWVLRVRSAFLASKKEGFELINLDRSLKAISKWIDTGGPTGYDLFLQPLRVKFGLEDT